MLNKEFILEEFSNNPLGADLSLKATREAFGEAIVDLAERNESVVVLNADLEGSLKLEKFRKKFPDRIFQVGVAEQALAGIGTGLALYGKVPFITSFAAFSPGLNWSQIRLAVISEANLKVASSHYGLTVGEDGPTAQALEDVALMRVLPKMLVLNPADANQTVQALAALAKHQGPGYIRFTRAKLPVFLRAESSFEVGVPQLLREGYEATVVATGSSVFETLIAAAELAQKGVELEVFNLHTIKPIKPELLRKSLEKTGKLITVEEHQIAGGAGSAVLEALASSGIPQTLQIGMDNEFGTSGSGSEIVKNFELDSTGIAAKISNFLHN